MIFVSQVAGLDLSSREKSGDSRSGGDNLPNRSKNCLDTLEINTSVFSPSLLCRRP